MTTTYPEMNNIFATLPIGFYLGRRLNIVLSKDSEMSYFDPMHDMVVISYSMIARAIASLPDTLSKEEVEEIVRGVVYHEVSHVILTPAELKSCGHNKRERDAINVLEDERIETIFRSFYMNTNFRKNIFILNMFDGVTPPATAWDAFYYLVRYHIGEEKWLNRLQNIIERYKNINAKTEYYYASDLGDAYVSFYRDFMDEYEDFESESYEMPDFGDGYGDGDSFGDATDSDGSTSVNMGRKSDSEEMDEEDAEDGSMDDTEGAEDGSDDTEDKGEGSDGSDDTEDEKDDSKGSDDTEGSEEGSDEKDTSNGKTSDDETAEEDGKATKNNGADSSSDETNSDGFEESTNSDESEEMDRAEKMSEKTKEMEVDTDIENLIDTVINQYYDTSIDSKLQNIIIQQNRRKTKNGSAIPSYSGRINPRLVGVRDDYKWWVQQNRVGHVRSYSKVHFNLYIDNSGSFRSNDDKMNTFIQSLNRVYDSKMVDFTFDIITINTSVREWSDTRKVFKSEGGNCVAPSIREVIMRHQKPNTNVVNVVLFDGDAHSDDDYKDYMKEGCTEPMLAFDRPDTIIISDNYNARYLRNAKKAKIKYLSYDYASEFIDTICTMLEHFV